jgi:nickel-dependent lactate racemase
MNKSLIKESGYLTEEEIDKLLLELSERLKKYNNILIIPPDITRKHSGIGNITSKLYKMIKNNISNIDIMPALGTHDEMKDQDIINMFGNEIPLDKFIVHKWREDTVKVGEISESLIRKLSDQKMTEPIPVRINKIIFDDQYDLILSIGQVIPHGVVGMANYTKNIVVGCGGDEIINKSHFLGALTGIERVLGKGETPVRKLYDYCQNEYLNDVPILYMLTVNSTEINPKTSLTDIKGIFTGKEREVYEKAVKLSQKENIVRVEKPLDKVVVYLNEKKFHSTWIGCKAIYRTRKAIADGGELIIIAPGIEKFGEDKEFDRLIRKYGYKGTEKTLENVRKNKELQQNLSAAAHLIHGSSEDRFKITFATKKLSKREVEKANFNYMSIEEALEKYKIKEFKYGFNNIDNGEEIFYIDNPTTGLWVV